MAEADLARFRQAGEVTKRMLDRAKELHESDSDTDKLIAHELFREVSARSSAQMRALLKASPVLAAVVKASRRRRKAAT